MENTQTSQKKPFYLVTTDIGMGFSVFLFVIGHTALWWDHTLDSQWPNLPLPAWLLLVVAFLVPPGFLFWYTFNSANSLLRRKTDAERKGSRHRLIKRTIIFFFVAEIGELATAIFLGKPIPNYLVTWELFHMFSFSTIFILVIFELAWMMERKGFGDHKKAAMAELVAIIIIVLGIYLIFHDYAQSRIIAHASDLTLESIFERILLDYGQAPIIPYLAFSAVGGLLALYLNLPNEDKINIPRKTIPVFILGAISFIVGIILLSVEIYTSPPVQSPISSNLVFISIGFHLITVTGGVILLDLDKLYGIPRINKLVLPLVLISKISLTVYLLHNLAYGIPAESNFIQAIIPSLEMSLFVGLLYALFWVLLAFFWQKSRFKLSIEWIIVNLQRKKWSWWKE
ncbi:MAG: hypothetical protein ACW98I_02765 [Candidatus Hodarchaeales archaeon]|jgi:hypothetical protein